MALFSRKRPEKTAELKQNTRKNMQNRLIFILICAGVILLLLIARLFYVMVIDGPRLESMAQHQQTRRSSVHAQRGRILDTNGTVLAQSGTTYMVLVNPQVITGEDAESERVRVSILLSELLDMNYDDVFAKVARTEKSQLVLKRQVSSDVVDQITALQLGRKVTFATDYTRYYSNGNLFAQLVGFTGADGEGQTGLEAYYDKTLTGTAGRMVYAKDARGNSIAASEEDGEYIAPINGSDVTVTADANAQTYLEQALADCMAYNRGSFAGGVLMDPNTGAVLAEGANPTFNLNSPNRDDVTSLMAMSRNRIVTEEYECGDMFKLIVLAAALDSGTVNEGTVFTCKGSLTFRTETLYCSAKHGHMTLAEAVTKDCDCAYMQMALWMGTDTLYRYIYAFGFGTKTGCGIPGEISGEVVHRKYIRQDDLARLGCGIGITATPLQMATAYCTLINGGIAMQPYILKSITSQDGTVTEETAPKQLRRVIKSETSAKMREYMQMKASSGEASGSLLANWSNGAMTGYAFRSSESDNKTLIVSSGVSFLPANEPSLLLYLFTDEPQVPAISGGSVIAPFLRSALTGLAQYYSILPDVQRECKEVPNLSGQSVSSAAYQLSRAGFSAAPYTESEEGAVVVSQVPAANSLVPRGTQVMLYSTMTTFSAEGLRSDLVTVPDFSKKRRQDAYDVAEKAGVTINFDVTACLGRVIAQSIEPGTKVEPGTEIYLTFDTEVPQYKASQGG